MNAPTSVPAADPASVMGLFDNSHQQIAAMLQRLTQLANDLAEQGTTLPLRTEVEIYQFIAEALNNVVKHAAASRLLLHLKCSGDHLRLRVADDGRGFDPKQGGGGMGLRNLRERVARLGGEITIWSAPGGGTQVEAVIPLPATSAPDCGEGGMLALARGGA